MDEEMNNGASAPEDAGRSTDTVIGHLSLGEIVIPRAMLDDPNFMQILQQAFQQSGMDIAEFTVGDKANKINPETGYPEFFSLGKILKSIAGIGLPILGGVFGGPLGAALGGGVGSAINGGSIGQDLLHAGIAGVGAGLTGTNGSLFSPGGSLEGTALGSLNSGITDFLGPIGTSVSSALSGAGNSIFGSAAGTPLADGAQGPTLGSGLNGAINTAGRSVGLGGGIGGLTGGSGGGSTFNIGSSLASALGGAGQQAAIKKAQQQLLAANQAQQANIGTFDPSNITNDAGYQFNLAQGQQGLDRQLAAGGDYFSGDALKAATKYNQDYANNALNSAYGRYTDTTGARNQLLANQGNIQSQGTIAGANGLGSALSGVLNPTSGLSQQDLLKLLSKQQGTSLYG